MGTTTPQILGPALLAVGLGRLEGRTFRIIAWLADRHVGTALCGPPHWNTHARSEPASRELPPRGWVNRPRRVHFGSFGRVWEVFRKRLALLGFFWVLLEAFKVFLGCPFAP